MKIDRSVRRATGIIALGVLALSALMELIYLILVLAIPSLSYDYSFPLGNLLMGVAVTLNFFLMSLGIQSAVDGGDPQLAKKKIQFSHTLRNILLVGILVLAFFAPCFHIVSTVITVIFPQLTVYLTRLFPRAHFEDAPADIPEGDAEGGAPADPDSGDAAEATPDSAHLPAAESPAVPEEDRHE